MALMRSIASSSLLLSYLGGQFLFLLGRAFRRNHRPPTNECKAGPDLRRLGCHSSVISRAAGAPPHPTRNHRGARTSRLCFLRWMGSSDLFLTSDPARKGGIIGPRRVSPG